MTRLFVIAQNAGLVIARSEATWRSPGLGFVVGDCFAALAMTGLFVGMTRLFVIAQNAGLVIARSEATWRSPGMGAVAGDCFAALAMTGLFVGMTRLFVIAQNAGLVIARSEATWRSSGMGSVAGDCFAALDGMDTEEKREALQTNESFRDFLNHSRRWRFANHVHAFWRRELK
jgi:hypothetical protein